MAAERPAIEPMTFANEFWEGYPTVARRAVDGKKSLDRLANFLKERAALDLQYGRNLKRLSESALAELEVPDSSLGQGLKQLEALTRVLAENYEIFAAKVMEQMRKPLERARDDMVQRAKAQLARGQELTRQFEAATARLEHSCAEAQKLCKQSQAAREAAMMAERHEAERADQLRDPAELRVYRENTERAKARATKLTRDAVAADKQYLADVRAMREFRQHYDAGMGALLSAMQDEEHARLVLVSETLQRFVEVQTAMIKNMACNTAMAAAALEQIDADADLALFVAKNRTGKRPPPLPEYRTFPGHPMYVEPPVAAAQQSPPPPPREEAAGASDAAQPAAAAAAASRSRSPSGSPSEEHSDSNESNGGSYVVVEAEGPAAPSSSPRAVGAAAPKLIQEYLDQIIPKSTIMSGSSLVPPTLSAQQREARRQQVLRLFATPPGRVAFAAVLNQQRNTNAALHLTEEGFEALGALIVKFLDEAHAAMHVRPAQLVMIMSQTFYRDPLPAERAAVEVARVAAAAASQLVDAAGESEEKRSGVHGERVYLAQRIRAHPIWRDARFWEEAFFDSYSQEMSKHQRLQKWHSESEQREAEQRQKNILFAQLGAFAHNMTEFGMPVRQTRTFIQRMCQIHELDAAHVEMLLLMPSLADVGDDAPP